MKEIIDKRDANARPNKEGVLRKYTSRRDKLLDNEDSDGVPVAGAGYE
jgi:hypothetical protein